MEANTQAIAREIDKGLELSEMVMKTMTVVEKCSRIEKDGKEMIKIVKCKVANYAKDDKPLRVAMENLGTATTKKIAMESLWDSIKSIFAKILKAITDFFKNIFGSSGASGAKQKRLQEETKKMEEDYAKRAKLLETGVEIKHTTMTGKLFSGIEPGHEFGKAMEYANVLEQYSNFTEGFTKAAEHLLENTMNHLLNTPVPKEDVMTVIRPDLVRFFKDMESVTTYKGTLIKALKEDNVENVDNYNLGGDVLEEKSTYLAFYSEDDDKKENKVSVGPGFNKNDSPKDSKIIVGKSNDFKKLNAKLTKIGDEKFGVAGSKASKGLKKLENESTKNFAAALTSFKTLSQEQQTTAKGYVLTFQYIAHCIKGYGIYNSEINKAKIGLLEFTKNSMQAVIDANGKENKDSK